MNILWIEDFDKLEPGTATLNLMFQDLMSFDNWDEDELSLLSKPSDLEKFFKENSALHCVFLCRHYFDYVDFKTNKDLTKGIDAVIIDIRLDNNVNFNDPIPSGFNDKAKFHQEAGFYIFNDLVHLGFPAEKMCFMTGEKNSFDTFKTRCSDIYIPEVVGFEKSNAEYGNLRQWIKERETDYSILRRGIIEGCEFLKSHIEKDEANIQFRDFIKIENQQPTIEIPAADMGNYLDTLAQFLPLLKQSDASTIFYRLFLRTFVHEWEENVEAKWLKEKHGNDLSKIRDIYTFAWLMKMTRNWVSHANLLEPLNPQFIAFLFLVNMRAMFKLPKAIQPYEKILLGCLSTSPEITNELENHIKNSENDINEILTCLKIPEYKVDKNGQQRFDKNGKEILKDFGDKINAIYRQNTGNPDAEPHDYQKFLLHYFWVNQKSDLRNLTAASDDFLPTLARHIYNLSFSLKNTEV